MSTYIVTFTETVRLIQGGHFRMIAMTILSNTGKIPIRSGIEYVNISNGVIVVNPFHRIISPNQKGLIAYFTTDAFTIFTGNVDISFGFGDEVIDTISNIAINSIIEPLPPLLSSIIYQDADNQWLANL